MTPPLGFWDPLGFSKFENAEVHLEVGVFMARFSECLTLNKRMIYYGF